MEILRIENLSFRYPKATEFAIENANLTINRGEFIVICGESGCGKTTLLKTIKPEIAPNGDLSGNIIYKGKNLNILPPEQLATEIGFVLQNPDSQIVTDKVWHELAFGLENMGLPNDVIRRRTAEMASYFGIQDWFRMDTDKLSGGQKQILNLASVMVTQPKILLLDEPTSQLDPIAASEFISTLQKLNRELGLTIVLVEHRLEDLFPIADKVLLMENGKVLHYDTPRNIGKIIKKDHRLMYGFPSTIRIFNSLSINDECPLTVNEGRNFLEKHFSFKITEVADYHHSENKVIELKNVSFRYEKHSPDILTDTDLTVYKGEIYSILGGNGVGKTTALNIIADLLKPYRGKVLVNGIDIKNYKGNTLYRNNISLLPQNPQFIFTKDSIIDDLKETAQTLSISNEKIYEICNSMNINHLLNAHPYDLSGGELQKCAIAKLLLTNPKILLLDEPTKGLDAYAKRQLSRLLKELKHNGITSVIVTHDIEFAAEISDRCALFFDGGIISCDIPEKFFAENSFYTTAANRIARDIYKNAVTVEQVIEYCKE